MLCSCIYVNRNSIFYNNSGVTTIEQVELSSHSKVFKRALRKLKIKNALNVKKRLEDKILLQVLTSNDLNLELSASCHNIFLKACGCRPCYTRKQPHLGRVLFRLHHSKYMAYLQYIKYNSSTLDRLRLTNHYLFKTQRKTTVCCGFRLQVSLPEAA